MSVNEISVAKIWDEKSENYPKFSGNLSEFGKRVFKILNRENFDFKGKTLIDIGAGTGIYALYFAKFCQNVVATDISSKMLEILKTSAKEYEISNITPILGDFSKLDFTQNFDFAFLSMSPALQNEIDFIKFIKIAKFHIYLNWQKPRKSSLLSPFYQNQNRVSQNTQNFINFLEKNKINYKSEILSENFSRKRAINEALQNAKWHLKINGINLSEAEILTELKKQEKGGFIIDKISTKIKLIWF